MNTHKKQFINSFEAYDKEENIYKINVFQSIIDIGSFQDPNSTRLGGFSLRTENGFSVKAVDIDRGEFLIIETNTTIYIKKE